MRWPVLGSLGWVLVEVLSGGFEAGAGWGAGGVDLGDAFGSGSGEGVDPAVLAVVVDPGVLGDRLGCHGFSAAG